ncbi:MAG: peptidase T [Bacteroidales bacterium]|nr:peptidase T [Bacteroidales bacterium]MDZ4204612.1 peptidase T [Bacteroidales bacterium]
MNINKNELLERFLRYVKIDTRSDESSTTFPSTGKQWTLAHLLCDELKAIGMEDVSIDDHAYVMATLPSNIDRKVPVLGFIAHVDTSPEMPGDNVKPQIVEDYSGEDIVLNAEKKILLSPSDFPELKNYIGHTLITTDGTTLLGADDKAGVAEIITAMDYLCKHPEIPHGTIKVAYTPDEEIGKGVDHFDVQKFGAQFAYTLDGGAIGELEFENFNAAGAKVFVQGRNIHPGYAKGKMINAMLLAMEFNNMLPEFEKPQYTQDYEGFYHLVKMEGGVENCNLQYIIRDHDKNIFENRKVFIQHVVGYLNQKYGEGTFTLELKDQYFNMRQQVEPAMHIIETARKAMEMAGIEPHIKPIRGGTDGARLSYMGLPCPNLFSGGHNFHGKHEYIPLESMLKAVEVILNIVKLYSEQEY